MNLSMCRSEGLHKDPAMMDRLTVEYDALLSRAVSTLYHSPGRTTWQFLAVLPFDSVSSKQLWKLFRFLLLGDDETVGKPKLRQDSGISLHFVLVNNLKKCFMYVMSGSFSSIFLYYNFWV